MPPQHLAHPTLFVCLCDTSQKQWVDVERLTQAFPDRTIPCFGVHPWFAHLHAIPQHSIGNSPTAAANIVSEPTLSGSEGEMLQIINLPKLAIPKQPFPNSSPNQPALYSEISNDDPATCACGNPPSTTSATPTINSSDTTTCGTAPTTTTTTSSTLSLQAILSIQPSHTWAAHLRQLLLTHPRSAVGECGIDAAAVIIGSGGASTKMSHQLALLSLHFDLAAELQRPLSMHCVRGYGPLLSLLQTRGPTTLPPRIMLHSYGGSTEMVVAFTRLPHVGRRIYFSFSTTINGKGREKLMARIAAVPRDRLLLESDQTSPLLVDAALVEIAQIIAEARQWTVEETQQICGMNFQEFYAGCM